MLHTYVHLCIHTSKWPFFLGLIGDRDSTDITITVIHTLVSYFYVFHASSLLTDSCAVLLSSARRECRLRNQRSCHFQSVLSGRSNKIRKKGGGKFSTKFIRDMSYCGDCPRKPGTTRINVRTVYRALRYVRTSRAYVRTYVRSTEEVISMGSVAVLYECVKGTSLLTPWCRVLLEKLNGLQLVKKFAAFHGTRRFITALTSVRHLSLSWASPIQSI